MSGLSVAMAAWQSIHLGGCGMATVAPLPRGSWQSVQAIFADWMWSLWLKGMGWVGAGGGVAEGGVGPVEPAVCACSEAEPKNTARMKIHFCTYETSCLKDNATGIRGVRRGFRRARLQEILLTWRPMDRSRLQRFGIWLPPAWVFGPGWYWAGFQPCKCRGRR